MHAGSSRPSSRAPWLTWSLWALVGLSVPFWLTQWPRPVPTLATTQALALNPGTDPALVERVLGGGLEVAPEANPEPSAATVNLSGLQLQGSVQGRDEQGRPMGVALIQREGERARPVRVGQVVAPGWRLQSVSGREAVLVSDDGRGLTQRLRMPSPDAP